MASYGFKKTKDDKAFAEALSKDLNIPIYESAKLDLLCIKPHGSLFGGVAIVNVSKFF